MSTRVPSIRFNEFTEEWKEVDFSEVFEEVNERTSDTANYPLFSLTLEKGVTPKSERYERSFLLKKDEDNYKIVKDDEFVYNPMNLTLGAVAKYNGGQSIAVSGYYNVFRTKEGFNSEFFENLLKTGKMILQYKSIATGSLIEKQRVHFSQFIKIKRSIPTFLEQKKIGDFFSLLDRKIEKQQDKIEQLELFKKGMLQKIYSQELRFKDDRGQDFPEWNIEIFEQIATNSSKKINPQSKTNIPCIELENIVGNRGQINGYFSSHEQQSTKNQFSKGAVLFGKLRPYLKKYWFATFDGICSSEIWVITTTNSKVCNEYLYFIIQSDMFQQAANVSSGSKMPRTEWDSIRSLDIPIPSLEEQKKIASFLFTLEEKILKEETKVKALNQLKAGLMQQMFI
ncbi:restriction endonuclease subunit S [Paenibacillus aceti]|uniref:Type I restriction-modification enzyme, S subunit n=1 Tax=Paenibacillus aceti TaxID=1820010 RepID=A0ABQ1VQ29_9BACL|nr:restriction endonuclease subunit S [Paenibacillus aceti]GGF88671.1 type I restriction-modification enzyme, S subunit [Paenibacillus aceti]